VAVVKLGGLLFWTTLHVRPATVLFSCTVSVDKRFGTCKHLGLMLVWRSLVMAAAFKEKFEVRALRSPISPVKTCAGPLVNVIITDVQTIVFPRSIPLRLSFRVTQRNSFPLPAKDNWQSAGNWQSYRAALCPGLGSNEVQVLCYNTSLLFWVLCNVTKYFFTKVLFTCTLLLFSSTFLLCNEVLK